MSDTMFEKAIKHLQSKYVAMDVNSRYLKDHSNEVIYAYQNNLNLIQLDDWMRFNDYMGKYVEYPVVKDTLEAFKKKNRKDIHEIELFDQKYTSELNEIVNQKDHIFRSGEQLFQLRSLDILDDTLDTIGGMLEPTVPLMYHFKDSLGLDIENIENITFLASYDFINELSRVLYTYQTTENQSIHSDYLNFDIKDLRTLKETFNDVSQELYGVSMYQYINEIRKEEGLRKFREHKSR